MNDRLSQNLELLGRGVHACIDAKLVTPALIVLYSAIDTLAWLNSESPNTSRKAFLTFVDDFMLPAKPLKCTSLELYAARCGLLHTFTPDSKLSDKGHVRRICIGWGTGNVDQFQQVIEATQNTDKYVAVHIDQLYESWSLGVTAFVESLNDNPPKAEAVQKKTTQFFSRLPQSIISNISDKLESH